MNLEETIAVVQQAHATAKAATEELWQEHCEAEKAWSAALAKQARLATCLETLKFLTTTETN